MSGILRFVIRVDSGWNVNVSCPSESAAWEQKLMQTFGAKTLVRTMGVIANVDGGRLPKPEVVLHKRFGDHEALGPPKDTTELVGAYASIVARMQPQIEAFGHYLFDALLGREVWAAMTTVTEESRYDTLELALALPDGDVDLHRINWEMMCSDDNFLAAGTPKLDVAITRLVDGPAELRARALSTPPRVLFVVGTALSDKRVRPGAELMGLLRRLKSSRSINYFLLEMAKPSQIKKAVATFKPDVVHFICHGGVDATGPYLELETDDKEASNRRSAGQLLALLRDGTRLPAIVVLSACNTAAADDYAYPAATGDVASMAERFITGGVPVVVGMSGRVTDMTCRLFTRQFGAAIVDGKPLVVAIAQARMATFADGRPEASTPDWALPTVYVSSGVDPAYVPVLQPADDAIWRQVELWITQSQLREKPVFCGRENLLSSVRDVLASDAVDPKQVIAIFARDPKLGVSRLLKEVAIQAIRDGHIPVLLTFPRQTGAAPTTLRQFAVKISERLAALPIRTQSPAPNPGEEGSRPDLQIDLLLGPAQLLGGKLDRSLIAAQREAGIDGWSPNLVRMALQLDLLRILEEARADYGKHFGPQSRVLLLLDHVDEYGAELASQLLLGEGGIVPTIGLGLKEQPVPVVVAFRLKGAAAEILDPIALEHTQTWIEMKELQPFGVGEDMLAISLVLLNQHTANLYPGLSDHSWAFSDMTKEDRDAILQIGLEFQLQHPGSLAGRNLYKAAAIAKKFALLNEADDEAWLPTLRKS